MKKEKADIIEWILKVGVAGTFIGHGCLALNTNPSWIPLLTSVGCSPGAATKLLPAIGILDIVLAAVVLIKPYKAILYWMVFWTFITALSRVIAGQSILEFVERFSNMACPLALLIYFVKGAD